jgi:predicted transcriptional regulator
MLDLPTHEDLRRYRLELRLTQTELAKRAGVSQSLIARIESGDIDPRLSTLRKIVTALKEEKEKEIKAKHIMKSPVIFIRPSDTVGHAYRLMEKYGISQLPVLKNGVQVGAISESKLIKEMNMEKDLSLVSKKKIEELMNDVFPTVGENTDLKVISRLMKFNPAVLVTVKGKIVGIITKADILKLIEKGK